MFFKTCKILQTLKKNTESKIDAHTCKILMFVIISMNK